MAPHNEHDRRGKFVFEQAASLFGQTYSEQEVPAADGQRIDLWFVRLPQFLQIPRYLALVGRMLECDAIVELYSQPVSLSAFMRNHRNDAA